MSVEQSVAHVVQANVSDSSRERLRLLFVHTIEALVAIASNLLTIGVFFFMQHRFGWGLLRNFSLSAGLGAVYIVGALAAHPVSVRFGRRGTLATMYLAIAAATLFCAIHTTPLVATATILLFAFCSAMTWPVVENLVSSGEPDPHLLSRRLAIYNMVWAAVGAIVVAANGLVIERFPLGVFLIPTGVCVVSAAIAMIAPIEPDARPVSDPQAPAPARPAPEPRLAQQRVIALWLSRICVPAMYLMIYSLAAMMPSLPILQPLSTSMQTLLSSVWLVARFLAFVLLGATIFWHTRPRLLLAAAAVLFISLLAITLRPSDLPGATTSQQLDLALMIAGQIAFGFATGLIYTASLYFGMVLSEGSTEHGGYHEALIGLGMTLGPAVGAMTQWISPKNTHAAVVGIAGLIGLSILLASIASIQLRRKPQ